MTMTAGGGGTTPSTTAVVVVVVVAVGVSFSSCISGTVDGLWLSKTSVRRPSNKDASCMVGGFFAGDSIGLLLLGFAVAVDNGGGLAVVALLLLPYGALSKWFDCCECSGFVVVCR